MYSYVLSGVPGVTLDVSRLGTACIIGVTLESISPWGNEITGPYATVCARQASARHHNFVKTLSACFAMLASSCRS